MNLQYSGFKKYIKISAFLVVMVLLLQSLSSCTKEVPQLYRHNNFYDNIFIFKDGYDYTEQLQTFSFNYERQEFRLPIIRPVDSSFAYPSMEDEIEILFYDVRANSIFFYEYIAFEKYKRIEGNKPDDFYHIDYEWIEGVFNLIVQLKQNDTNEERSIIVVPSILPSKSRDIGGNAWLEIHQLPSSPTMIEK